jgi:hypothetical protein
MDPMLQNQIKDWILLAAMAVFCGSVLYIIATVVSGEK